jgi:hypothetical protein
MTNRRRALLGVLAAAVATLAAALMWNTGSESVGRHPTGIRVTVIGVDGLDWVLVGRYVDQGTLPNLGRILRSGVAGDVVADRPVLPSVGWTIMGRGAALTEREAAALTRPAGGRLFGIAPEVLRLAEASGATTLSVGWPCSWPAADAGAPMIAAYEPPADDHPVALTPSLFAGAPGQATSTRLSEIVDDAAARNLSTLERDFVETIHEGESSDRMAREHLEEARWAFLSDRITLDVAARIIAEEEPDLSLVCLRGMDAVAHRFLGPAAPGAFPGQEPVFPELGDVLPAYYRFIDAAIGRMARLADARTLLIVCSAYGTHPSQACPPASAGHERGAPGVFLARGPDLPEADEALSVTTADFAPTILAALGVPIPSDMEGRPIIAALPQRLVVERGPVRGISGRARREAVDLSPELAVMDSLVEARLEILASEP